MYIYSYSKEKRPTKYFNIYIDSMQLNYIESEDLEKIRKSVDLSKGGEDLSTYTYYVCLFFDLVNKTFSIEIRVYPAFAYLTQLHCTLCM